MAGNDLPRSSPGEQSEVISLDLDACCSSRKAVLVGQILAMKKISWGTVKGVLRWAWSEFGEIRITSIGLNKFMFEFDRDSCAEKVLRDGPWSIDGSWLVLANWPAEKSIDDIDLSYVHVWVQIHGLPRDQMNLKNAGAIGRLIGEVVEVEDEDSRWGGRRDLMRVRVAMNVDKELKKGAWVQRPGGNKQWVAFKYERLSSFCFNCGKLNHTSKQCKKEKIEGEKEEFGSWLRATVGRSSNVVLNKEKEVSHGQDKNSKEVAGSKEEIRTKVAEECPEPIVESFRNECGDVDNLGQGEGDKQEEHGDKEKEDVVSRDIGGDSIQCREKKDNVVGLNKGNESSYCGMGGGSEKDNSLGVAASYYVEIPSDEENIEKSKAIVPYGLDWAMKKLSLKRKIEEETDENKRFVKRRTVSRGVDAPVGRRMVERGRRVRRGVKRNLQKSNREGNTNLEGDSWVEIKIDFQADMFKGCGGLPGKATEKP